MPAGTRLSTGIVVEETNESAFTYVTTPGHMFAGRIVFSAYDDDGETVAQVEMWLRASDPLFEMSLPLAGHARDDRFWEATLQNLAAYFGASANLDTFKEAVDPHRQWRNWTNIVRNSYIRTAWHLVTLPFRRLAARLTGSGHGR